MDFYERWLRFALERPRWMAVFAVMLVIAVIRAAINSLGTDLLPEMDEGGFIVDYLSPAGSSLQETNRMVSHVEQMLREIPEVESTSRRTGLELGLAAVTEANRGDIAVKLKSKRSRSGEEIISELRARVEQEEPGLEVEYVQVLQDMIGDLSNAPEPVQIKLFSPDAALLEQWAPKVGDAIHDVHGVVDMRNGIENTISGPATVFQVNPTVAARAGFTPEEVAINASAILEGEPAATPVIAQDIAYTIRVRYPGSEPRFAGGDEQHAAEQLVGTHGNSRLARGDQGVARTDGDSPREPATRCGGHRAPRRTRSGQLPSPRCRRWSTVCIFLRRFAWCMAEPTRSSSSRFTTCCWCWCWRSCWCSWCCCSSSARWRPRSRFSRRRCFRLRAYFWRC